MGKTRFVEGCVKQPGPKPVGLFGFARCPKHFKQTLLHSVLCQIGRQRQTLGLPRVHRFFLCHCAQAAKPLSAPGLARFNSLNGLIHSKLSQFRCAAEVKSNAFFQNFVKDDGGNRVIFWAEVDFWPKTPILPQPPPAKDKHELLPQRELMLWITYDPRFFGYL